MRSNHSNRFLGLGVLAVLVVIGLGVQGWILAHQPPGDALYRSLQAFALGDIYAGFDDPQKKIEPVARPFLEGARWIGAFLAFYAVFLLLWSTLGTWRTALRARGRRGHLTVVGATPFADRLSEAASGDDLRTRVVQSRDPDQRPAAYGLLIRLPFHGFDHDGLDEAGTGRAQRLVVAVADDATAIDLALAAHRRYPGLSIMARLKDGGLLNNLRDLPGGETLRAFSEPEAAAREIVRRHPPVPARRG